MKSILLFSFLLIWGSRLQAQEKPLKLDIGGIELVVGESQDVALRQLGAAYNVRFEPEFRFWMVTCKNEMEKPIGSIQFTGGKLSYISSRIERICGGELLGGVDAIRLIQDGIRRLHSYSSVRCMVVTVEREIFTRTVMSCGDYHSLSIEAEKKSERWRADLSVVAPFHK